MIALLTLAFADPGALDAAYQREYAYLQAEATALRSQRAALLEQRTARVAEAEAALPGLLGRMEPASPGMHRSDTVDFIYVLSGEIWLELDAGQERLLREGDTAIQNGTRHAWRNRSGKPCQLLIVMAGAHRAATAG